MYAMTTTQSHRLVGFGALSKVSMSYYRKNDGVYIADSEDDMWKVLRDENMSLDNYMIDPIEMEDLVRDVGDTHGVYSLELDAYEQFKSIADSIELHYRMTPEKSCDAEESDLFIIEIEE